MLIDFGGVTYDYEAARIDVRTAIVIRDHTKMGMLSWAKAVDDADPVALQGILYAMKVQAGERPAIRNLNFFPAELYQAIAEASQREIVETVTARAAADVEEDDQPAADPTVTVSLAEADPKADADLSVYRARYLFALAHVCHLTPADIDALTVGDFWSLVTATERYHRALQGKG